MGKKTKEEKKILRKEKLEKFLCNSKNFLETALIVLVCVVLVSLFGFFMTWIYQDSNRTAVEVPYQGTVKKSEIIYVPAHYDKGKELPAKVVNYLEVECKNDSTTFKLTPAYLNEFIQEGDTVTVYTYHSKIYNLKSDIIRYRWNGELYE
jgi:hypothetical protein